MNERREFWNRVADTLRDIADSKKTSRLVFPDRWKLSDGQRANLSAISARLPSNGVVIADEVGMGKTRLAAAVIRAVIENGGRVAIVIPPGLGFQWTDELKDAGVQATELLRSLGQYFSVWSAANRDNASAYAAEATRSPWAARSIALISHAFANWRLGESSQPWRWTVLPHVYARWRRHESGRLPHGFNVDENLDNATIARAADAIVEEARQIGLPAESFLDELLDVEWPETRNPGNYSKGGRLRAAFEKLIGLGLGAFDLVVIDEAHKSRHADTGLAKLIERAMWMKDDHRRLALTATPVELNPEQWKDILNRIKAPTAGIDTAIDTYARAVRDVRRIPSNTAAQEAYFNAARGFEEALKPYLLRRDKREDEAVRRFVEGRGLGHDAYRRESEIVVDPSDPGLDSGWRRAICAAEALSHIGGNASDGRSKRVRLTVGSGHGIAALLEEPLRENKEDPALDDNAESDAEATEIARDEPPSATRKREERRDWWNGLIRSLASSGDQALYDHPAIRAAVDAIESSTAVGEKVLVFGRYTRPLRALVRLLNAREMWRAIDRGEHWPQSKLDDEEWSAAETAQDQLGRQRPMSREELTDCLADGYRLLENARERFRRRLLDVLEKGFSALGDHLFSVERALLTALRRANQSASQHRADSDLAIVARALHTLGVESLETDDAPRRSAEAFIDLIGALRDRDEGDDNDDGVIDPGEAMALWGKLSERLRSEYARSEGNHARLLFGGTELATRRLLQLAFNREQSNPKVLVAQSIVGREGLNLHRACRTVVLLHPEWNPGVVEQQIGRVDRIGSRWQILCERRAENTDRAADWPRIEIRPVIFKGTYDEQNWEVLRERWRDLRAQLHGIVLPEWEVTPELREIARKINVNAPQFSPSRELNSSADSAH
jgi:hypothetical protein